MKQRPMWPRTDRWFCLLIACLAMTVVLGACESTDQRCVAPVDEEITEGELRVQMNHGASQADGDESKGFFPLDLGNRWTYTGELSLGGESGIPSVIHKVEERTIIGTEELFGREYILEEQEITDDFSDDIYTYWLRYRQDRAGLYEADVPVTQPPGGNGYGNARAPIDVDVRGRQFALLWRNMSATIQSEHAESYRNARDRLMEKLRIVDCLLGRNTRGAPALSGLPGGVLPDEITRLLYPLHPRQEWIIRNDPYFASIVEGQEVLDLAPGKMNGYKIRILSELMDPGDEVLIWYGRKGFLGSYIHLIIEVTNPDGDVIDVLVSEERLFLESFDLAQEGQRD